LILAIGEAAFGILLELGGAAGDVLG